MLSHPEQETEYIELFDRGKQRNRQEEEVGKELEERYGYTPFDGRSVKNFCCIWNRNGDGFCGRTWSFMGFVFAK